MKRLAILAIAFAFLACGDDEDDDKVRVVAPGAMYSGLVGGRASYQFDDSVLSQDVSGNMTLSFAQGVFEEAAFPTEVTFSVLEPDGDTLAAAVTIPAVRATTNGLYEGTWVEGEYSATIQFQITGTEALQAIELQAFTYSEPLTTSEPSSRRTRLSGQLRRDDTQLIR